MDPKVQYLPDDRISVAQDYELRELLTTCFRKPQDWIFRERRYFCEPYPHRWVIRDDAGAVVAHIGVHDKRVEAGGRTYRIGGIGEVCVHPRHRKKGYVRLMLQVIHPWMAQHGFDFAVLFGDSRVYGSSGYRVVNNLFKETEPGKERKPIGAAMIHELSATPWPEGEVILPGLTF